MIILENDFTFEGSYPIDRLGKRDQLLFFDIETTGFSGDRNQIYLIGAVCFNDRSAHTIQWFADTPESESQVIECFFDLLRSYRSLIHFNGDTFDIPFLLKRCHALKLNRSFDHVESIDIFKRIRPYKRHLGLSDMKQKSIEAFLGIEREDTYDGGQLIHVYEDYLDSHDPDLLKLLLLHNEEDLKGMLKLLPILFYPDYFNQEFTLTSFQRVAGETPRLILSLCGDPETILPVPIRAAVPSYAFRAEKTSMALSIKLFEGTLKYFYPNYKDYYYLPCEDTAIHKSVGGYVDKNARIKATKETCYTKKNSVFLPQPSVIWTPEFRMSPKDRVSYFEFCPECLNDPKALNTYIKEIWAELF